MANSHAVCVCGRIAFEVEDQGAPRRNGRSLVRIACFHCREVMHQFHFRRRVPVATILVVHTYDVERVTVLRDRVQIVVGYTRGNREGSRGGELLAAETLFKALDVRRELMEAKRAGQGQRPLKEE